MKIRGRGGMKLINIKNFDYQISIWSKKEYSWFDDIVLVKPFLPRPVISFLSPVQRRPLMYSVNATKCVTSLSISNVRFSANLKYFSGINASSINVILPTNNCSNSLRSEGDNFVI